jgi:hypothetical protein
MMKSLVPLSAMVGLLPMATTVFAESGGLSLEMGRLSYSGSYVKQVVMVNASNTAYATIKLRVLPRV